MNTHSVFFKAFPPPKALLAEHAGLDISDDAVKCIQYKRTSHGLAMFVHAEERLPVGLVNGGDIKDRKEFVGLLADFATKNRISRVKVSLPEEKVYLFQTEVPSADFRSIAQNIESKLDQNVPLSAPDALFQFDLMPRAVTGDLLRASVSVVPRTYVERSLEIFREAKMNPVAFEAVPKAIVSAYLGYGELGTHLIVHIMDRKSGLYIVSEGVVCFTSTVMWGAAELKESDSASIAPLMNEIARVYSYWVGRSDIRGGIAEVVVVGDRAEECETLIRNHGGEAVAHTTLPDVWRNAFDVSRDIPPISRAQSFGYAAAAGLAL